MHHVGADLAMSGGVLAIDPGPVESAWVQYDGREPGEFGKSPNEYVLFSLLNRDPLVDHYAIEMVQSFGMSVGREVFDTVYWIGRFAQAAAPFPHTLVYRLDVKMHLCKSARARDANIRAALLDRFGGKEAAIGTKKQPGPLYGISGDVWQALAVAVTWHDQSVAGVSDTAGVDPYRLATVSRA